MNHLRSCWTELSSCPGQLWLGYKADTSKEALECPQKQNDLAPTQQSNNAPKPPTKLSGRQFKTPRQSHEPLTWPLFVPEFLLTCWCDRYGMRNGMTPGFGLLLLETASWMVHDLLVLSR